MSTYLVVLTMHSWMRWAVLALGAAATVNAFASRREDPARPGRSRWDTFFMAAVDLQVLLGLFLYFGLSPSTTAGMNDFNAALHTPVLLFWTVTHITTMFGGMLLVRVGRVLAINAPTLEARRRRKVIAFTLALVTLLAGIPWPGTSVGRPLFRF